MPDANAYCAEFADCRNVIYSSPRAGLRISVIRNIIIIIITVSLIINNFSTDRMGLGGNGNSPHGNPIGMGISQKMGMGMGGNGN